MIYTKRLVLRRALLGLVVLLIQALPAAAQEEQPVAPAISSNGALPPLAEFGLAPGQEISRQNFKQHPKLMSPGIAWGIEMGWRMPLVEAKPVDLPRRYREATERYASQVELGEEGTTLKGYVAGRPFPEIDPNDPWAALKIMWNYYYGFGITDDLDARYFDATSGRVSPNAAMEPERTLLIDHYRKLNYNGRLYIDPKPELPNPEGVRFKESHHPILAPFDMKGVGATYYRYLDPKRQDDNWLYIPQLRKVKRMSTAQRSSAMFAQDIDVDSYGGYNGHIAWMNYKFLGERVVLGCMHAKNIPARWQDPEDWLFYDDWEPRSVWIVEASSPLNQYAYGKRILYMDKETYLIPHSDIYDKNGELWKAWVNMFAIPDQGVDMEEDVFPHGAGVVMYDVQLSHSTKAAIPSEKMAAQGKEAIFINKGEEAGTTEEFFSISHLIQGR